MIENKVILVTGGAGFIGSHLCQELSEKNRVLSLDNYTTGKIANHIDGVDYISGPTSEIEYKVQISPDIIYHLGEYSRVEQSFSDVEKVMASNIHGTLKVVEFASQTHAKLIYAGSSTKFQHGVQEEDITPYTWTKARNTNFINAYSNWKKLNFAIVYFYNVYGGRELDDGPYATVIAKFKKQYSDGKPLTVVEPGTQKRNFTHVNDVTSALLKVAQFGSGDDYGIGSETSHTIDEVAKMFRSDIVYTSPRRGNRSSAEVRTAKMANLNWFAKENLADHITDFVKQHEQ